MWPPLFYLHVIIYYVEKALLIDSKQLCDSLKHLLAPSTEERFEDHLVASKKKKSTLFGSFGDSISFCSPGLTKNSLGSTGFPRIYGNPISL